MSTENCFPSLPRVPLLHQLGADLQFLPAGCLRYAGRLSAARGLRKSLADEKLLLAFRRREGRFADAEIYSTKSSDWTCFTLKNRFCSSFPGFGDLLVVRTSDDAATETNTSMVRHNHSRRSFFKTSTALVWVFPLSHFLDQRGPGGGHAPLFAYVGTFSSSLRDTLPTQVDLPPGNGRGILLFRIDRTTGTMTAIGEVEMDNSPSCLALNGTGTRLYSANETDRVGRDKQGSISAFAVNRVDGKLELLNTVVLAAPGRPMSACTLTGDICSWPTTTAVRWRCSPSWPTAAWVTRLT